MVRTRWVGWMTRPWPAVAEAARHRNGFLGRFRCARPGGGGIAGQCRRTPTNPVRDLADGLGGEERIEDARQVFAGGAATRIRDLDPDALVVEARADGDPAPFGADR